MASKTINMHIRSIKVLLKLEIWFSQACPDDAGWQSHVQSMTYLSARCVTPCTIFPPLVWTKWTKLQVWTHPESSIWVLKFWFPAETVWILLCDQEDICPFCAPKIVFTLGHVCLVCSDQSEQVIWHSQCRQTRWPLFTFLVWISLASPLWLSPKRRQCATYSSFPKGDEDQMCPCWQSVLSC